MHIPSMYFVVLSLSVIISNTFAYDERGYVVYCPCMGRFGNQADHFLGSLAFAKKLNRTLVVPPWINHVYTSGYKNSFVPYSKWFKMDALKPFHRVISMEHFMENEATEIWTSHSRKVYCHKQAMDRSEDKQSCPAKTGNPFGPFWNNFNIDFSTSEAFPPQLSYFSSKKEWDNAYPPAKNLVLAFMGAPAAYPVEENHKQLQKYVEWSDEMVKFTSEFLHKYLERPYVGIHLRNGVDWKRACEHITGDNTYPFMSSPQCIGPEKGKSNVFTKEMCLPKKKTVIKQVVEMVKQYKAKSLFIATDSESFKKDFIKAFSLASLDVEVTQLGHDNLAKDLALLIEADAFRGSCASSVTAFVVRKRNILQKPNHFFGIFDDNNNGKSEL